MRVKPNYSSLIKEVKKLIVEKSIEVDESVDQVVDDVIGLLYDWMYEEEDM